MTHTLEFLEALRLLIVEGGEIDDTEFSQLMYDIDDEIRLNPNDGVDTIMARWGYWWVMKA